MKNYFWLLVLLLVMGNYSILGAMLSKGKKTENTNNKKPDSDKILIKNRRKEQKEQKSRMKQMKIGKKKSGK